MAKWELAVCLQHVKSHLNAMFWSYKKAIVDCKIYRHFHLKNDDRRYLFFSFHFVCLIWIACRQSKYPKIPWNHIFADYCVPRRVLKRTKKNNCRWYNNWQDSIESNGQNIINHLYFSMLCALNKRWSMIRGMQRVYFLTFYVCILWVSHVLNFLLFSVSITFIFLLKLVFNAKRVLETENMDFIVVVFLIFI